MARIPHWQHLKASHIHSAFVTLYDSRIAEAQPIMEALEALAPKLNGKMLDGKHSIKASAGSLKTLWYAWLKKGRKASALLPDYNCGTKKHFLPDLLKQEIQRLASAKVGSRDKNKNGRSSKSIWEELNAKWQAGSEVPGLGNWKHWWSVNHADIPLPYKAPEFPFSYESINRYTGSKAIRVWGSNGKAAANAHLPCISLDYSKLRRCEAYTLDDVRLDLVALDEITGRVVEVTCYLLMEISSRYIVSFVMKPKNAIQAADVDELIACGLSTDGFGVGDGYVTHIIFERGTIACSEAAQVLLEAGSEGGIKVHRTGMDGGISWIGAAKDKASGHAMGKGAMEAFNKKLHEMLITLPGQRGNNWQNQPANLGVGENEVKDPSRSNKETLVMRNERLAQFKVTARQHGISADVKFDLLTLGELRARFAEAIKQYNHTSGHGCKGFHTRTEAEIAPNVWQPVNQYDRN